MSYRRTWLLVDAMNRCWIDKLVETTLGGGSSRGARLTPLGRHVLAQYRCMEERIVEAAARDVKSLSTLMREAPLPSKASPAVSPSAPADEGDSTKA